MHTISVYLYLTTKKMNVIVLAPHPDDGEFGCGGSIHKLVQEGCTVFYVYFSNCHKSIPKGIDKDILSHELQKATKHLGIKNENIIGLNFPVREFPKYRQEILEELIVLRKKINPELVLLPNSDDVHQDHQVINQEGIRAFKHASILGYELPWNNLVFTSNFHYCLSSENLKAKWNAINEYKSQGFRNYKSEDFTISLARVRGTQIGKEYAEAFELIRWIS